MTFARATPLPHPFGHRSQPWFTAQVGSNPTRIHFAGPWPLDGVSASSSLLLTWSAERVADQRAEVAELAVLRAGREPGQGLSQGQIRKDHPGSEARWRVTQEGSMKPCKARIMPWALQWSQPSWDLSLGALGRPHLTLVTVFPHVLLIAVTAFAFSTSLGVGRAWLEKPLAPNPSGDDHFSC